MRDGAAPVAAVVEDVLNAAHDVAAAGLEMDNRVDADLHMALLRLVNAVYEHEEALELQRELDLQGVRAAQVFDVTADRPPAISYPAHVERILAAADGVAQRAAAPAAAPLPHAGLTPVCTLMEAVAAYHDQAAAAREWQRAGNRLRLLANDGPTDTEPPPPSTSQVRTRHTESALDADAPPHLDPPGGGAGAGAADDATSAPRAQPSPDERAAEARVRPAMRLRL